MVFHQDAIDFFQQPGLAQAFDDLELGALAVALDEYRGIPVPRQQRFQDGGGIPDHDSLVLQVGFFRGRVRRAHHIRVILGIGYDQFGIRPAQTELKALDFFLQCRVEGEVALGQGEGRRKRLESVDRADLVLVGEVQ
jgi:hypothetical protein